MERVAAVGLVVALALGLGSLALTARVSNHATPPGIRRLPITLLLYNLWIAAFLALSISQDHAGRPPETLGPPPVDAGNFGLLALALVWLYAHIAQLDAFARADPAAAPRDARRVSLCFAALLAAGWCIATASGNPIVFQYAAALARLAIFPTALVASVVFVLRSRHVPDRVPGIRHARLGIAYAVLFTCLTALSVGWGWLGSIAAGLPIVIDVVLEAVYNVAAIVWLMRVTPSLSDAAAGPREQQPATRDVTALLAARRITKREAEIIQLICLGKTNQEIADALFISLTTVKDHNYVTFQKLGVRNRTELARLILEETRVQPK